MLGNRPGFGSRPCRVTDSTRSPERFRQYAPVACSLRRTLKDLKINRSAAAKAMTLLPSLMLASVLSGCDAAAQAASGIAEAISQPPSGTSQLESPDDSVTPSDVATARAQLETIPVKGRAPKTGYAREEFGPAWADVDRNGCDTRNDILARDLEGETFKPGTQNCVVTTGTLKDKYTGTTINFIRGNTTSSAVQIDHMVALSDAWQKGAQQLSADQRKQLANDPLNLMAADGPTNGAKGDKDAATWLPPNKGFRCEYVVRQAAVKAKYSLWATQAEHGAMAGILTDCS